MLFLAALRSITHWMSYEKRAQCNNRCPTVSDRRRNGDGTALVHIDRHNSLRRITISWRPEIRKWFMTLFRLFFQRSSAADALERESEETSSVFRRAKVDLVWEKKKNKYEENEEKIVRRPLQFRFLIFSQLHKTFQSLRAVTHSCASSLVTRDFIGGASAPKVF